ncbi:MAG TPA: glycerophosphodiester phosphodiesterase [Burkholderiaceae bacterium]|nr:glycerophosphodiester phosphodiesterase [Burkholderiaceae bacterium]
MSHFLPWPYARVIAHRGGGRLAPENTIAAIDIGRAHGFSAIECDAMLAADGIPVLIHDPTLERTTNGRGAVAEQPAAALTALDAGAWFAPRFAGTRLPTLEAAVRHCRAHDVWINVEIKPSPGAEVETGTVVGRTATALYADVVRPGGDQAAEIEPRAPLLSSFYPQALQAARAAAPDLPRGFLLERVPPDFPAWLGKLGCVALHTDHKNLTREQAHAIKAAGYWLFCYTVNDPERARQLFAWGVDAFCTDRIDLIGPRFA